MNMPRARERVIVVVCIAFIAKTLTRLDRMKQTRQKEQTRRRLHRV
jgi:hypothetical protein